MKFSRLLIAVFLPLLAFSTHLFGAPLGAWFAYTANLGSDNATPIQLAPNTGTPFTSISLAGTTTTFPVDVAITPDGNRAYIIENAEDGSVSNLVVINTLTNIVVTIEPLGGDHTSIAITPNGQTAYVTNVSTGEVTPIDITTPDTPIIGTAIPLPLGSNPVDIAITPDGLTAYVVDNDGQVIPIDITTNPPTVGTPIPVGSDPTSIAITPNGESAYVVNTLDSTVSVIDLATSATITIPGILPDPSVIAINSIGTRAYVASTDGSNDSYLTVIDIANNTLVGGPVPLGSSVVISGIAITPDSRTAYLTNFGIESGGDTVIPVDVSTDILVVGTPISLAAVEGLGPSAIAITPDQAPVAFFTATGDTLGLPTLFDASASFSPVGTIVQYAWDFGDGASLVTTNPLVSHTYAAPGEYVVVLTVTNSAGTSTTQTFTGQTVSNNGGPPAVFSRAILIIAPIPPIPPVIPILPPTHLHGVQKINKFASQVDYINVLTWKAPYLGTPPVAYRIYRNAKLTNLVATISFNCLGFFAFFH